MRKRAFKYRFYPTPEQEAFLLRSCGAVRWVWNWGLATRTTAWRERGERVSGHDVERMLTVVKQQPGTRWLNDVPDVVLRQALRQQDQAFTNFFNSVAGKREGPRVGYPRFKARGTAKRSLRYVGKDFTVKNGNVFLAKMKDAPLDIVWSRPLPKGTRVSSITVSCDRAGRWHVSLLVEDEIKPANVTGAIVGIDVGVKTFGVLSDGGTIELPERIRRKEARVRRYQKRLARTQKSSANRGKARVKLARAHAQVADTRRAFHHEKTTDLVRTYDVIAVEDLNVAGLTRRPKPRLAPNGKRYVPNGARRKAGLNRALLRAGLAEFRSLLEYKADWYGKRVVVIDRYHPSSRLCSDCGWKNSELRLPDRTWSCRECGTLHDRDLNAARNILAAGLVVLENERESARLGQACRADIRPQDPVPLGPLTNPGSSAAAPAVKQETLTLEPAPA